MGDSDSDDERGSDAGVDDVASVHSSETEEDEDDDNEEALGSAADVQRDEDYDPTLGVNVAKAAKQQRDDVIDTITQLRSLPRVLSPDVFANALRAARESAAAGETPPRPVITLKPMTARAAAEVPMEMRDCPAETEHKCAITDFHAKFGERAMLMLDTPTPRESSTDASAASPLQEFACVTWPHADYCGMRASKWIVPYPSAGRAFVFGGVFSEPIAPGVVWCVGNGQDEQHVVRWLQCLTPAVEWISHVGVPSTWSDKVRARVWQWCRKYMGGRVSMVVVEPPGIPELMSYVPPRTLRVAQVVFGRRDLLSQQATDATGMADAVGFDILPNEHKAECLQRIEERRKRSPTGKFTPEEWEQEFVIRVCTPDHIAKARTYKQSSPEYDLVRHQGFHIGGSWVYKCQLPADSALVRSELMRITWNVHQLNNQWFEQGHLHEQRGVEYFELALRAGLLNPAAMKDNDPVTFSIGSLKRAAQERLRGDPSVLPTVKSLGEDGCGLYIDAEYPVLSFSPDALAWYTAPGSTNPYMVLGEVKTLSTMSDKVLKAYEWQMRWGLGLLRRCGINATVAINVIVQHHIVRFIAIQHDDALFQIAMDAALVMYRQRILPLLASRDSGTLPYMQLDNPILVPDAE